MPKLLLSQSQATAVLTTTLIALFTLLLFLVGYTTQQRTVSGLQEALRPRIPQAPPPQSPLQDTATSQQQPLSHSRAFRGSHVVHTTFSLSSTAESANWHRLAHVQIVRRHADMCNAIMVLAELHKLKSPARRILLFPQAWAVEKKASKGEISDPFLDSSRRLMRLAARRYGVELRPMSPVIQATRSGGDGDGHVYSLASAYALADLDRALTLETPGLVLDASPLDAVLAFTEDAPFGMLQDTDRSDGVHTEDLFLIQPNLDLHAQLKHTIASLPPGPGTYNDTLFPSLFAEGHLLLSPTSDATTLIRSIGTLHTVPTSFNASAFVKETSYIRFSDPKLPGPEYEVPWSMKRDARPRNKDADWTWTKLYGQFEHKRREICGLGLESWRPD